MVNKGVKRIGIFIIAYKAVNTLDRVIDRIPKKVMDKVEEVYIFDDCSDDNTYYAVLGYKLEKKLDKLKIYINEQNLGYGGNQKRGYDYALRKGFDIVVMLHGDGQYPPELLSELLEPLEKNRADMVFGSRMTGNPLKGGMPMYKYFGNKFLTYLENKFLDTGFSEFHSGYRLYNCHALKKVPYHNCSDGFPFDTDILIMFKEAGLKIAETDIPTFYGDEISRVKVFRYGLDCIKAVVEYWLCKKGFIKNNRFRKEI